MSRRSWVAKLERTAATAVVAFIVVLLTAPVVAAVLGRLFYRREITDFTLGGSGYPVIGPVIGAVGFGVSALFSFASLRGMDRDSEGTMLAFLFSLLGLIALSGLALWRIVA
jgi:hypothetical protein